MGDAGAMTRDKAEQKLHDHLWQHDDSEAVDFMSSRALGKALRSAPHEVLAAAMGGTWWTEFGSHDGRVVFEMRNTWDTPTVTRTVIGLPWREVDGEGE